MQNKLCMDPSAFEFRYLEKTDNLADAARLIYQTDSFIYPALLGSIQNAEIIMPKILLQSEGCFQLKNMFAAVNGEQIAGLIYSIHRDFIWTPENFLSMFECNCIAIPEHFFNVSANYFDKITNDKEIQRNIYIMNVCVSTSMRYLGIGTKLINAFFDRYPSEQMSLHVLSNNASAIHLYNKLGFRVRKETTGYSPNPPLPQCYYMSTLL